MARRYVMTARRKAALKKAQIASARKRRKGGNGKKTRKRSSRNVKIVAATGGLLGAALLAGYGARGKVEKRRSSKKAAHDRRQRNMAPGLAVAPRYGYGYKPGRGRGYMTDGRPARLRQQRTSRRTRISNLPGTSNFLMQFQVYQNYMGRQTRLYR